VREYLAEVTNQIFFYINEAESHPDDNERQNNLILAAGLGCATFRRLDNDPQFREYVVICTKRYSENRENPEVKKIREDYKRLNDFLDQETEVLVRAGVRLSIAKKLTHTVLQMREQYGPEELRYRSPEDIYSLVAEHKDSACNTWKELQALMSGKNKRNAVRRIGFGIGGATIIAGNAAVDAGIIGLSFGMVPVPVTSSLSLSAGGALLGKLIGDMFPD
jgi:hypothetical protein